MGRVRVEMKEKVNVRTAEQWFPASRMEDVFPYGVLDYCPDCEREDAPKIHGLAVVVGQNRVVCPGDWLIYSDGTLIAIQTPAQFEQTFEIVEEGNGSEGGAQHHPV